MKVEPFDDTNIIESAKVKTSEDDSTVNSEESFGILMDPFVQDDASSDEEIISHNVEDDDTLPSNDDDSLTSIDVSSQTLLEADDLILNEAFLTTTDLDETQNDERQTDAFDDDHSTDETQKFPYEEDEIKLRQYISFFNEPEKEIDNCDENQTENYKDDSRKSKLEHELPERVIEADFVEAQKEILSTEDNTVALTHHEESNLINDKCKMVYIENIIDKDEGDKKWFRNMLQVCKTGKVPFLGLLSEVIDNKLIKLLRQHDYKYIENVRTLRKPNLLQKEKFIRNCGTRLFIFRRCFTTVPVKFQAINDVFQVKNETDLDLIDYQMKKFLKINENDFEFTLKVSRKQRILYLPKEKLTFDVEEEVVDNIKKELRSFSIMTEFEETKKFIPEEVFISKDNEDEEFIQKFERDIVRGVPDSNETNSEEELQRIHAEKVLKTINSKINELKDITDEQREQLRELYIKHKSIFALEQARCKMSKLEPIVVELKPEHPDFIQRPRNMNFDKLTFLKAKIKDLIKVKMIKPCYNSTFGSPVFLVPKKGPKRWRMVVDLRLLNFWTRKTPLDIPNLENALIHIQNAKFFMGADALSGYDFLRVHPNSYKYFTMVTPIGTYEMMGAPMGWTNTAQYFSYRIIQQILLPTGLYCSENEGVIQWIDDSLIYSESFDGLIKNCDKIFTKFNEMQVRLNISKCVVFATTLEFCGRIITYKNWRFADKYWNKVLSLSKPQKLWELAQIIYIAQWMANSVPYFSKMREKLTSLSGVEMNASMKKLKKENGDIIWTTNLKEAWEEFQLILEETRKKNLLNYSNTATTVLVTDASRQHWSIIIMQTDDNIPKNCELMSLNVKPLFYLSGTFKKNQVKWHIDQKELFPIIYAFNRFKELLVLPDREIVIFNDHLALKFILNPEKVKNMNNLNRLSRWATTIQQVNTRVISISSKDNMLADSLTRWGYTQEAVEVLKKSEKRINHKFVEEFEIEEAEYEANLTVAAFEKVIKRKYGLEVVIKRKCSLEVNEMETKNVHFGMETEEIVEVHQANIRKLQEQILDHFKHEDVSFYNPYYTGTMKPLTEELIRKYQQNYLKSFKGEVLRNAKGQIIMPKESIEHVIVDNHLKNMHFSQELDELMIKQWDFENVEKSLIKQMIQVYRSICLHCGRRPFSFRRPLGQVIIAKAPRAVIAMDYLYIANKIAILVILDVYSRKTMLLKAEQEDAKTTALGLLQWHAKFTLKADTLFISDNGSHFANQLIKEITEKIRVFQRFSIAYAPWTNGHVESKHSSILKLIRTLRSELRWSTDEWSEEQNLAVIEATINNIPMRSRANFTANELFLGVKRDSVAQVFGVEKDKRNTAVKLISKIMEDNEEFKVAVNDFQEELNQVGKKVYEIIETKRKQARKRLNKLIPAVQFRVGEWVLMSTKDLPSRKDKTRKIWQGPFLVTAVTGHNIYQIQSLLGKTYTVHATRLFFYSIERKVPEDYVRKIHKLDWGHFEVEKILQVILDNDGQILIKIKWYGFKDATFEKIEDVVFGAHLLLKKYIQNNRSMDKTLKKACTRIIDQRESNLNTAVVIKAKDEDINEDKNEEVKELVVMVKVPTYMKGWTKNEVICLKQLIKKYPLGDWNVYKKFLPSRNKNMIVNKLKFILNERNIKQFHGKIINWTSDDFSVPDNIFKTKNRDLRRDNITKSIINQANENLKLNYDVILLNANKLIIQRYNMDLRKINNLEKQKEELFVKYSWKNTDFAIQMFSRNHFLIVSKKLKYVIISIPEGSKIIKKNIDELELGYFKESDIVLVDPPWQLSSKNQCVQHQTLPKNIIFKQVNKLTTNVIGIYVTNYCLLDVLEWLDDNQYKIWGMIDIIHFYRSGKMKKNVGNYLQHSKDMLIIGLKKEKKIKIKEQVVDAILSVKNLKNGKDNLVNLMMETLFDNKNAKFKEVYARNGNVRTNWTSIGLELEENQEVQSVIVNSHLIDDDFKV